MILKPSENSYYVIPDKFLAGEYPRDIDEESSIRKIKSLITAGVRTFIDLTTKNDKLKPYDYLLKPYSSLNIQHFNFPIPDFSVPSSENQTIEILDTIEKYIETGTIVYLHCWGGVGRTGVIAGCWLAEHGYPGEAALSRLRDLWKECAKSNGRKSPETKEQEEYIINWLKHKQEILQKVTVIIA